MAKLTEGKMEVIQELLEEYDIQTTEDIQNAYLKELSRLRLKEESTKIGAKVWLASKILYTQKQKIFLL